MTKVKVPITIRVAAVLEAANIVRLLKQHWTEQCGLAPERVNDTKALAHVMRVMELGQVIVADRAGRLVGVAGVTTRVEEWSDDSFIDLVWLYAVPFNTKVMNGDMTAETANTLRRETAEALLVEVEGFADKAGLPMYVPVFGTDPVNHDQIFASRRYLRMGGVHFRAPNEVADGLVATG